jgi:hypothetical protein
LIRKLLTVCLCVAGVHTPASRISTIQNSDTSPSSSTTTAPKETFNVQQILNIHTRTSTTSTPNRDKDTVQNFAWAEPSRLAELPVPNNRYWDKVAWCETRRNWKDKGRYAGGLGIYINTWNGFGGEEFASKQWKATRLEQILVANRIAIRGWLAPNGFFQKPVGFNGWGCIRNYGYLKPTVPSPWTRRHHERR